MFLLSCKDQKQENKNKEINKFDEFIQKEKFVQDRSILYPGISDPVLKPILTQKVNQAAEDFKEVAIKEHPTKQQYLEVMKVGLSRFSTNLPFDTEDRERVCHYFEELMHMVGLESSEGQLNMFLYGFDPDEPINKATNK
ncbi:MAG TPA: DUF4844 domain-containing protein [Flavisolibacter sp.]|nr:DUF4844 domain-containing protein [Flavisolibacter sp.]